VQTRKVEREDYVTIQVVVREAFRSNEPEETVVFLDRLRAEGCVLAEWLVENETGVIAHIAFSRVWIAQGSGYRVSAAMLTPFAVKPEHQRQGYGKRLMAFSIDSLERDGETIFLVLGHPGYYPIAGFSSELACSIKSPWDDNPAFMARGNSIPSGILVLPKSILEAH
jgi:putative acetyltransferase